jgi:2-iminobutanoate/2-iminopropanoate deaminase
MGAGLPADLMPHARIQAEGAAVKQAAYSPAVVAGDLCFVSGQLPIDPATGKLSGSDPREQTRRALTNLFAVLERAGFRASELVSVTVLLADITHWEAMNAVYAEMMAEHGLPARVAFEAGALPLGALVEIVATAVREDGA